MFPNCSPCVISLTDFEYRPIQSEPGSEKVRSNLLEFAVAYCSTPTLFVSFSQGSSDVARSFFERNREERPELIDGLLREGELAAFAGPFGMGKSPVLADLTVRLVHGLNWCGRRVQRRPVIVFDCETPGPDYKKTIEVIAGRLGVPVPRVPSELDVYLERDYLTESSTEALLKATTEPGHDSKLALIERALRSKPNAIVLVDPVEMLFQLDTTKKPEVLRLFRKLREILARFPHGAILGTFNLRKKDRRGVKADLLSDARDWLEEVSGSLDIVNRSDARLGIDMLDDEVRVINGIVRGREMHPILIRPVADKDDQLAGFEQVTADQFNLLRSLSQAQRNYWDKLPKEFKFEDIADKTVPRSSLSRLTKATLSLGILVRCDNGTFKKVG